MCIFRTIIESIEAFADFAGLVNLENEPGSITFARQNFATLTLARDPSSTPSELVQAGFGLDINSSDIDFTQGQFLSSPVNTSSGGTSFLASVLVSSTLYQVFQDTSTQNERFIRLVFVVYDVNSSLFQDPNVETTGSVILSFLRSPLQGPAPMDLEEPVTFQFQVCNYDSRIPRLHSGR